MIQGVLIACVMAILVYGAVRILFLPFVQKGTTRCKPVKNGLEAYAVILKVQPTGTYINNHPQVCMLVKVQPQAGRNFVTEIKHVVSQLELPSLRVGSCLKVKYNPHNVKELTVIK